MSDSERSGLEPLFELMVNFIESKLWRPPDDYWAGTIQWLKDEHGLSHDEAGQMMMEYKYG